MIKVNVFFTDKKFVLKNLVLNENKTFIIGKVQDKNDKLNYISTKWEINKETKKCTCVLGDSDYDFSIIGLYIPGLNEETPKVKKNFYTFDKDAWHCKLYEWVYGKKPHKVHPTMCPYFWIMVVTLLVFPLILIVKMFGKTGTKFLEATSTYQRRKRERQEQRKIKKQQDWVKNICETWDKISKPDLVKLRNSSEWDLYYRYLPQDIENKIWSKYYNYLDELRQEKVRKQQEQWLKEEAERALRPKKVVKPIVEKSKVVKPKIKKDSKTVKIIGIGFISIFAALCIWGLYKTTIKLFNSIDWSWVGWGVLIILGGIAGIICLYFAVVYILMPFITYVIIPGYNFTADKIIIPLSKFIYNKILIPFWKYCIVLPVVYCIFKPVEYGLLKPILYGVEKIEEADYGWFGKIIDKIGKSITFIAGLVVYPFIMIYKGFIYMIEVFQMCKDLIYQMYKKNCPRITWTDGDISSEEYSNFIDTGNIDYSRLVSIADKIKNQESLTEREMAIFTDKTSTINNIISNN